MHEHKAEGGREGGRKRPLLEAEAMADPLRGSGKRSEKVMKGIRLGRSLVNHLVCHGCFRNSLGLFGCYS